MARDIDIAKIKPHHLFRMLPEEIDAEDAANTRSVTHTPEEIETTARSIMDEGQLEPVLVRRAGGDKLTMVAGFGRRKAVVLINSTLRPDPPTKLLCRLFDGNAEDAMKAGFRENMDRKELTPIDIAEGCRKFQDQFGWSRQRCAEFFKKTVAYLGPLGKLLRLDEPLKAAVANGTLGVAAALDLAKLPEEQRQEVVAAATDPETGKVDAAPIAAAVRVQAQDDGKGKVRTVKEIKRFLAAPLDPAEYAGRKSVRFLADTFIEYINGKITERDMIAAFDEHCRET